MSQLPLEPKPLLVVFDAHALVHRAYHALSGNRPDSPRFSVGRTGEPTGAVFGFVNTLLKVLRDLKPSHWAIAFDRPTPTFRHQEFPEYKAQRPSAPDELRQQFRRVRELVEAFRLPVYEMDGFEADDVLGTLCRQASALELDSIIITGDTDTMQLVSPRARVLLPSRNFGDMDLYGEEEVRQKYGVSPPQMIDLKALQGDVTDNIPGIPGVGEKTALKLVQQFNSVEGIFEHLGEVTPARLQNLLKDYRDTAFRNKRLATIVTDLPMNLDIEACRIVSYDRPRVLEIFRELEFTSVISRLPETKEETTAAVAEVRKKDYRLVTTEEALEGLLKALRASSGFVFDVETTGREAMAVDLVGLSFSTAPGLAWYIPVGHKNGAQFPLDRVLSALKPLFEDEKVPKTAHNGKYDLTVLSRYGIQGVNLEFDTMVAAWLLGERALGLKALAFSKLEVEMTPITALIGTGAKQVSMAQLSPEAVLEYACADADMTGRLREVLGKELKQQGLERLFNEVEMPLLPILLEMEQAGVALDAELLRGMSQSLGGEMGRLEEDIYNLVGHHFNINSSQQLADVLYQELRLPKGRKTKTGYSTEASVLEELRGAHPVIDLILKYRELMKLKSTYVDALPALVNEQTGRVHTTFQQTGTATGRLSSSDPNLQNIPVRTELGRQVRHAFIPSSLGNVLLAADYSQIDLRVLAHLSQDPALLAAFHRDEDIHKATAALVFSVEPGQVTPDMRRIAKTVNFGVIYGMSDYGLEQATDLTREEAARFIESYFEKYPGVKAYLEATKRQAREMGYVETVLDRRRYIPEINSANAQVRQAAERMAINMPVQGTSADIIKLAMIKLNRRLKEEGLKARMVLQIHDELIFDLPVGEVPRVSALAEDIMPQALTLSVPLKVQVKTGRNWGEME